MGITGGTFLYQLNSIITGLGFLREKILPNRDYHLDSDGATLTTTTSTNPGWAKHETNITGLNWAATKVVKAGYDFAVPLDYDNTKDELVIKLKVKGADLGTLVMAAYKDDASTTDLAPDAVTLTAASIWHEFSLSGNNIEGGDVIHFNVVPASNSSNTVELNGTKIEYASDLVAFDQSDR